MVRCNKNNRVHQYFRSCALSLSFAMACLSLYLLYVEGCLLASQVLHFILFLKYLNTLNERKEFLLAGWSDVSENDSQNYDYGSPRTLIVWFE